MVYAFDELYMRTNELISNGVYFVEITFQNKIRVLLGGGWSLLMAELRKSHFLLMEVSAFSDLCFITCCDNFALSFFYLPILSFLLPSLPYQFS